MTAGRGAILAVAGQSLIQGPLAADDGSVAEFVAGADMALTGFEGTVDVPGAWTTKEKTVHRARPEALRSLAALGFNSLALANNHAYDLGVPGIEATCAAAEAAGFLAAGTGTDMTSATGPANAERNGVSVALVSLDLGPQPDIVRARDATGGSAARPGLNAVRVHTSLAVPSEDFERLSAIARASGHGERTARRIRVGYQAAPGEDALDFHGLDVVPGEEIEERRRPDADDLARNLAAIEQARSRARLVVACAHSHHWAPEWSETPAWMRGFAHALIDAGAHAFVGHGTPVFQGMEIYRGRPIFYGLGNLVFHTRRSDRYDAAGIDVWRSVVARCAYAPDSGIARIEVAALAVGTPASGKNADAPPPVLLAGEAAREVLTVFLERSRLDGIDARMSDDRLVIRT